MRGWLAKLAEFFGYEDPESGLSERDILYRRTRAIAHECGHAVIAWLSPSVVKAPSVTFKPSGDRAAAATITLNRGHPDYLTDNALVSLGGMAGEVLVWERVSSGGFADDLSHAQEALTAFLKASSVDVLRRRWNGHLAESSIDVAAMFRQRPPADLADALNLSYRRAKRLIMDNRAGFDRLIALAEKQGDLSSEDIASQFGPRVWAARR